MKCARCEDATDIPVLGIGIERDQFVAMLAVRLKSVADIPGSLSEKLRAFGAFDFDFIFGHEMALGSKSAVSRPKLKRLLMVPLLARRSFIDFSGIWRISIEWLRLGSRRAIAS
jgi:hypothetical protein